MSVEDRSPSEGRLNPHNSSSESEERKEAILSIFRRLAPPEKKVKDKYTPLDGPEIFASQTRVEEAASSILTIADSAGSSQDPYEQATVCPPKGWEEVFVDCLEDIKNATNKLNEIGPYFPHQRDIFRAFRAVALKDVRVVIVGQDPYPQLSRDGLPTATGMSFSVRREDPVVPASLRNIYKELSDEYPNFRQPSHGDLSRWAEQGVLLLNKALTVTQGQPGVGPHEKMWSGFIFKVVKAITVANPKVIFVMWGADAQKLERLLSEKIRRLKGVHPSPMSARRGFFGCGHFRQVNLLLHSDFTSRMTVYLRSLQTSLDKMESSILGPSDVVSGSEESRDTEELSRSEKVQDIDLLRETVREISDNIQTRSYREALDSFLARMRQIETVNEKRGWSFPLHLKERLEQAAALEIDWKIE